MFDVNLERIYEDEETVLFRLSWYAGGEWQEKWIEKRKDELEDEP